MRLNPFTNPIGLDISDYKFRFMQLVQKRTAYAITAYGEINVPDGVVTEGEIKDPARARQLLDQLFAQPAYGKPANKYINAALPEKKIFIKTITIPAVPPPEIAGAVSWGIEQNIPVVVDDVYFDWQIIPADKGKQSDKMTALVSVAPKKLVNAYTSLIHGDKHVLAGLENESIAIARCLVPQNTPYGKAVLLIDLGRSRTNIMVYHRQAIQFNVSFDVNGQAMTRAIAKAMSLSEQDAEKAKIICGLDSRKARGAVKKILEPVISRVVDKIGEAADYYAHYMNADTQISNIILTGSVSKMVGLPDYIRQQTGIAVSIGNPWQNIPLGKKSKQIASGNFRSYSTAIGLSLKRFV